MSRFGEVTQKTRLPCKPTGIRSEDFTKHFELQTGAKAALRRDQSERGNNKAPSFPPRWCRSFFHLMAQKTAHDAPHRVNFTRAGGEQRDAPEKKREKKQREEFPVALKTSRREFQTGGGSFGVL